MAEFLSDGFRASTLVLLCLFGYTLIRHESRSTRKNVFLFFLLTFLGYLLAYWRPLHSYPTLYSITFFLSIQFPLAFWIMSKALFDDDFKWNWKYWILITLVPLLHYLLYRLNEISSSEYTEAFRFLPYLLSVSFIVLAIVEALKNRENDLVVSRLKKRNAFVIFSSLLALASVYFFFTKDPLQLPLSFELLQNVLSCFFIIWIFGAQLTYHNLFGESSGAIKKSAEDKDLEIQKRIIEKLQHSFEEEKLYTHEGLTISKLAEHIAEKEYLLRRAINGQLGYTNFNNFLNHYRIQEACSLIKENKLKEFTFQEIAFSMGYQSVATFNRAFKKETEKTPSEYARVIG